MRRGRPGAPAGKRQGALAKKKKPRTVRAARRFPERARDDWHGPILSYREVELLRKFLTSSCKVMSRKRAGTSAREQAAVQAAVKRARYLALVPYTGT
jgi:small subunit ribosomal protein S18